MKRREPTPVDILPDAPEHAVIPPDDNPDGVWRHVNLSAWEYRRIVELLGREPNALELELFGVMWSEHCSYKNTRALLRRLPVEGPRIVQGPGENAGAIRVGRRSVVFKIESHNHPSYIEPFHGAATGVGGILRDIFTMGARPVAVLESLRFGPPNEPKQQELLSGVRAGIADYARGMGVAAVASEIRFDESYSRNCLVNAMAVGVADGPLAKGLAVGPGNPVLVFGRPTGRDGVRSASFASRELESSASSQAEARVHAGADVHPEEREHGESAGASNVPVIPEGDPEVGRRLMEATLELLQTGAVAGMQDMGAAGFTSSACEMAARAGTGIDIDVSRVPKVDDSVQPFEVMLSETQERMLAVVYRGQETAVTDVLEKCGLSYGFCGVVTDDGVVRVRDGDAVLAEVPARLLADEAPCYVRPFAEPPEQGELVSADPAGLPEPEDYGAVLDALLAAPTIVTGRLVEATKVEATKVEATKVEATKVEATKVEATKFEAAKFEAAKVEAAKVEAAKVKAAKVKAAMVEGDTAEAGGDGSSVDGASVADTVPGAAVIDLSVPEEQADHDETAIAVCTYGNGRHVYLDPYIGTQGCVATAARMVAATGAVPAAITNGLNFGNPEKPHIYWQLERSLTGMADACRALDTPVTGGNASLFNETDGQPVHPTPIIGMVGVLPAADKALPTGFQRAGHVVLLLGVTETDMGGTEYAAVWHGVTAGRPPMVDLERETRLYGLMQKLVEHGLPTAAHAVTDGGLAVALAEMAMLAAPGAAGCHVTVTTGGTSVAGETDINSGGALDEGADPNSSNEGPGPAPSVALFSESHGRIVVEAPVYSASTIAELAAAAGVPCQVLGRVADGDVRIHDSAGEPLIIRSTEALMARWKEALP